MKQILMTVMKHFKQVKVVHHLPGRLRLYIPLLERLSSEWRCYQSDLIDIIKLKDGLVDIDMSIISGRVLIYYDPERTNQSEILEWFKNLAVTLCEGYASAPFQSRQQILPFLKKMHAKFHHLVQEERHARESA